jgi:hypothetical protein
MDSTATMNNALLGLVLEKGGLYLGAPPVIRHHQCPQVEVLMEPWEDHHGD